MDKRFFAVALLALLPACLGAPVAPGFISTAPASRGAVGVGAGAGPAMLLGEGVTVAGGGAFHLDPFVSPRLSIPIELGLGGRGGGAAGISRFGLRYRPLDRFSLGFGGGPGFLANTDFDDRLVFNPYGAVDLEFAFSDRWGNVGLSAVARPSFAIYGNYAEMFGTLAASPAFYVTDNMALTIHLITGPRFGFDSSGVDGVLGMLVAGLGFYGRFGGSEE